MACSVCCSCLAPAFEVPSRIDLLYRHWLVLLTATPICLTYSPSLLSLSLLPLSLLLLLSLSLSPHSFDAFAHRLRIPSHHTPTPRDESDEEHLRDDRRWAVAGGGEGWSGQGRGLERGRFLWGALLRQGQR